MAGPMDDELPKCPNEKVLKIVFPIWDRMCAAVVPDSDRYFIYDFPWTFTVVARI